MNLTLLLSLLCCLATRCHGYTVVQPEISLMEPQGIRFAYPDGGGTVNQVSYHYNINKPLAGVAASDYAADVTTSQGGYFVLENTNIALVPGDIVSYWINVIASGGGYDLTDQIWVAPYPTTTQPPTQPPSTTQQPDTETPPVVTNEPPTPAPTTTESSSGGGTGGGTGGGGGTVIVDGCSSYPCDSSVCDMNQPPCNGLIFEETWDDFNLDRWQHELTMSGGGNWEFQMYTNNRSNSYVRDNTLFIKPTLTADHYGESFLSTGTVDLWGSTPADFCTANSFWGCMRTGSGTNYINPAKSARIRTVNSFSFKYGRVDVEAKMPTGDWLWPAIWMLPKVNRYGQWPASGEMDIIESRGNSNLKDSSGVSHGNDAMGSTMHWGPFWPLNGYTKTTTEQHGTYASEFHKYSVDWKKDSITFYIDDNEIMTVDPGDAGFWELGDFETQAPGSDNPWANSDNKMTPFDQEFFLIINLAVGGTNGFFPDEWINGNGAKPWNNNSPTAMRDFWNGKNSWYPTWQPDVNNGENAALQVKTIRVWAN